MRVLAVGNMYPPHHLGGYEVVWRAAMEHLRKRGHDVRVLTTDFRLDAPDGSIEEGDYVERSLRWYWRDHKFARITGLRARRIESHNAQAFDGALADFQPEVISWWSMAGMSLSLLTRERPSGIRSLAVVHEDWPVYWGLHLGFDPSAVESWSFNSEAQKQSVQDAIEGAGGRVDHPGIDAALFREAPVRDWDWRLLYCGRLDKRKGVDLTIKALPELPEAHLRIVGGGDDRYQGTLTSLAADLGVSERVTFETLPRSELPAAYAAADAVLFPVRWEEPFGLVPLEAMAVGRPVVASGRGGSAEYLEDGANALIAPPTPADVVAAVQRLAADPALRARLREGGLQTAARNTEAAFAEAIEDAHAEVLAK